MRWKLPRGALIVCVRTALATLADALRKNGIFIEAPVTLPASKNSASTELHPVASISLARTLPMEEVTVAMLGSMPSTRELEPEEAERPRRRSAQARMPFDALAI